MEGMVEASEQQLQKTKNNIIQVGRTTFRITRALSKKAVRVLKALNESGQKEHQRIQQFWQRYGTHAGYLEIQSENRNVIRDFEERMSHYGIEYEKLPELQYQDGKTHFLYNLDKVDSLKSCIQDYEADRIDSLRQAKAKFGADTANYRIAKAHLQADMPDVRLITVEEYAETAFHSDGEATVELETIENRVKEAELERRDIPAETKDEELEDLLKELTLQNEIDAGTVEPLHVGNIEQESLTIAGRNTDLLKITSNDDRYVMLLPKEALKEEGTVLIKKNAVYKLIDKAENRIVEKAGTDVGLTMCPEAVSKAVLAVKKAAEIAKNVTDKVKETAEEAVEERSRGRSR